MTATLEELKEALVETLENRGVLGQVKAKVRAEIFAALDDEQVPRPQLPRENVIINELFREYLEYNGYHHSLSVLLPESGHPEARQFDRQFLAKELRLQEDDRSRSLPLIYALVRGLRSHQSELPEQTSAPSGPAEASSTAPRTLAAASTTLPPTSTIQAWAASGAAGASRAAAGDCNAPRQGGGAGTAEPLSALLQDQADMLIIRGGTEG
mmetsp:Transcript_60566/g.107898  ORF Transcript_60566/g.107898 Transcript_60566/m.107898 type:complete len:211 (-) Transcript_60566:7-639(-)